jgi:hypothetical protein
VSAAGCRVARERGRAGATASQPDGPARRRLTLAAVWVGALLLASAGTWSAIPTAQAACQEGARTGLPECRVYELVTPLYTEGVPVEPPRGMFAVSEEGSRLIGWSSGVFAGTEEDLLDPGSPLPGAVYELARTAEGWQPSPLGPPASVYRRAGMYDASTTLQSTLWELDRRSQPEGVTDLYVEQPRGTFVEVGPPTPDPEAANAGDYTYEGASSDLSHILFTVAPGHRWPFDRTAATGSTLYEYVGTGDTEPALVGVSGGAGSDELVSECGTLLGSSTPEQGGGSMYNAISANGARVFFTAVGADEGTCGGRQPPVNELLAREETAPGEARTVAISEPSLAYCVGSPSPPCADAHFEGASLDGSKVFFTSAQKLLPEASEGRDNLYEYDFGAPAGENLALVSSGATPTESAGAEVQGVARISEDGSHVYFVAKGVLSEAANAVGAKAAAGGDDLYVYQREEPAAGHVTFVATLAPEDQSDWSAADERPVLASAAGRYLVFTSVADLTNEGTPAGVTQVFRYDAQTGELVRASSGETRGEAHGSSIVAQPVNRLDSPTDAASTPAPEDGVVFFESDDALTPRAVSGGPYLYEYDAGELDLVAEGPYSPTVEGVPTLRLLGSDPSGDDIFFSSVAHLVAQDVDPQLDIYDARVGGSSYTPLPPVCETSAACRPAPTPPPVMPIAGSTTPPAGGGATDSTSQVTTAPTTPTPTTTPPPTGESSPAPATTSGAAHPTASARQRRPAASTGKHPRRHRDERRRRRRRRTTSTDHNGGAHHAMAAGARG